MYFNNLQIIILTFNEEIHIERCIKSLKSITNNILVVDSYSSDQTYNICKKLGVKILRNKWINYSSQFNFALTKVNKSSKWIMRMDADEYLDEELKIELRKIIKEIDENIFGIYIRRKVFFLGKWLKYGGVYPQNLLRIWRKGYANIESRWMDEHIVLNNQNYKTTQANGHIIDDNKKGISFWISKHNSYSSRELIDILNSDYFFYLDRKEFSNSRSSQAKSKRLLKTSLYSKLPLFWRVLIYFFYRYFILLGFLDGARGFFWHFLQGLWYRMLIDIKLFELKLICNNNKKLVNLFLKTHHGIDTKKFD